jgi:hypothetical protein
MSRSATKTASDHPEFLVTREFFNRYFEKPLPRSTFHDLVSKGKITPFKDLKGFYELNASLRRMGLPQVRELPNPQSMEDIVRLAFTLIDRNLFPEPSWLLTVEAIDMKVADHARLLADRHRDKVESFDHVALKLAYFQGVLDWPAMEKTEGQ